MRYFLSILFVILSLSLSAQTTYYVDPSGTDGAGISGDISHPWKTLAYACTRVSSGDEIHLNEGTFIETATSYVPTGVSITGEGSLSILTSGNALYPLISLTSAVEGTNGNQTLSYFKIDGNEAIRQGIYIYKRSNVILQNIDIIDCLQAGIRAFGGGTYAGGYYDSPGVPPTTYETGNKILNCNITNCSNRTANNHANITIGSQDGMEIAYCTIRQDGNPVNQNGDILSGWGTHFKNLNYHHNISYKPIAEPGFNFHIEIGNTWGGNKVHHCEFHNGTGMSIGGFFNVKGDEDYSWDIYSNLVTSDRQLSSTEESASWGIVLEGTNEYTRIRLNHIRNKMCAISQTLNQPYTSAEPDRWQYDVRVFSNLMTDIGSLNNHWTWFVAIVTTGLVAPIENSYYYNNVMIGNGAQGGIYLEAKIDEIKGLTLANNIIMNTHGYGWLTIRNSSGGISNVYSRNNNIYDNTNNNAIYYFSGTSITNLVQTNNLAVNPVFVSSTDFHLQSVSPLIDRGLDVGLTVDYDSVAIPIGSAPDIGAYEYGVPSPAIDPTVVSTTRPYWTSPTTATSGGYVTDDGGGTVTARGVCWNTSGSPTITDSHTSNGSGTGAYTAFLTGLNDKLLYYVRAYATNESGTSYGAQLTFRSSQVIRNREIPAGMTTGGTVKLIRIN